MNTDTLYQLRESSAVQMMSYVIKTKQGSLIVIDGGNRDDAQHLLDFLHELSGGRRPTISAWLFTHAHGDHIDAFCELTENRRGEFDVENIYYNFITYDFALENEPQWAHSVLDFENALLAHDRERCHVVHTGDVIRVDDITFDVMYEPENTIKENAVNNTSVVYMMHICAQRVLFLGDLGAEAGERVAAMYKNGELKADIIQMAHHGQNGVRRDFYERVSPAVCLWPTPLWLWNNDAGGGYDTHTWQTICVRGWMEELGAAEHYKSHEGDAELIFPYIMKK